MPTQIASLFAKIGADTRDLNKGLQTAQGDMKDASQKMEGSLGGVTRGLKVMGAAIMASGVVKVAKAAFEMGKLGAASLRTADTFKNISGGALQAAANLEAMRTATRGAVADTDLMAASNQLMQMGLANNSDELERLTTMAVRLGTAMGRTATESINEFGLMLANQSVQRLDTFGIAAGKTRDRTNELVESLGLARDEAFKLATMEMGDKAMLRLGEATDDAASSFERLDTKIKNIKTTMGEELAPALSKLLDKVILVIDEVPKLGLRMQQLGLIVKASALEADGFHDAAVALIDDFGDLDDAASDSAQSIDDWLAELRAAPDTVFEPVLRVIREIPQAFDEMLAGLDAAGERAAFVAGEMERLAKAGNDVAETFGELEFDNQELWKLALATGASVEALGELAMHLGIATDAEIQAALKTQELVEAFGAGTISARDMALSVAQVGRDMFAAELAAANLANALNGIPGNINTIVRTQYISEGNPPSHGGAAVAEQEFGFPEDPNRFGRTANTTVTAIPASSGGTVILAPIMIQRDDYTNQNGEWQWERLAELVQRVAGI